MTFRERCQELESIIESSYSAGTSIDEAERLAANFLHAQIQVSNELAKADLDSRMRKSGVKAIRGSIYLKIVQSTDKKPTETTIESMINTNELVNTEQEAHDRAEVYKAELERFYDVFLNAHIYYRGIAKSGGNG